MASGKEKIAFERGYRVTSAGSVIGFRGKPLKPWKDKDGYLVFRLGKSDGNILVHRMIAYQLFGESLYAPGIEVRHLDGNPLNNVTTNLALGSASDNAMDKKPAVRHRAAKNAASFLRKLTDEQVLSLREERANGATYLVLCKKYKLAKSTVSYLCRGLTYSELVKPVSRSPVKRLFPGRSRGSEPTLPGSS